MHFGKPLIGCDMLALETPLGPNWPIVDVLHGDNLVLLWEAAMYEEVHRKMRRAHHHELRDLGFAGLCG